MGLLIIGFILRRFAFWIVFSLVFMTFAHARDVTDMTGRVVEVPDRITKIYGTSPPSTCILYAMAPTLIAGINYPFNEEELTFLPPNAATLPVIGGWFGQGRTPSMETLLDIKPDVMVAAIWRNPALGEKSEELMERVGLPAFRVILDNTLDYPAMFRSLGHLLNMEQRGETLAAYGEKALAEVALAVSGIAEDQKPWVYYAEGLDGLNTDCDQSVHAELIRLCGGRNIYQCAATSGYGMEKASIEEVILRNPDVIVVHKRSFFDGIYADPRWQRIKAVREKRVVLIPNTPFNWFDRPPSFMRLLGIKWFANFLHPDRYPIDIKKETLYFYQLFFGITLNEAQLRYLLGF